MFPSGAYSGNRSSSFGETMLIPCHFVWPYGGKRVFLSGSFTGWSEHILMPPLEDSPNTFQVMCNLTPGYHQYMFNVDGEWRHDELKPFISGSYGVVNTLCLAKEAEMLPTNSNTEVTSRSSMDVDDTAFLRMATQSDGISRNMIPRVPETDIEISRSRISLFLSQHTAYELLPESGCCAGC